LEKEGHKTQALTVTYRQADNKPDRIFPFILCCYFII